MKGFFYSLHYLILLTILSIPFWSLRYLKYGIYIPWILNLLWIIFGNCPITLVHGHNDENTEKENSPSFTHEILAKINPNITREYTNIILNFTLITIVMIGMFRLQK